MRQHAKPAFPLHFILTASLLLTFGCDIDHGLKPLHSRIIGSVTFDGVPPPDTLVSVAEVRVAVTKKFPPENLTTDILYSGRLEINRDPSGSRQYTIPFEVPAPEGVYPAVGVLWREAGKSWEITNLLGLYTDPLSLAPKPVVLTEQTPVVSDIGLFVDWQLAYRDAFIEGDISFQGEWPEDTEIIALGVFSRIPDPKNPFDFITSLIGLNFNIPLFANQPAHYRARVPSGDVKFIAVFWKGKSGVLLDIRAVGFYQCPDDPTVPRTVHARRKKTTTGVDIAVDFNSLPGGVQYALSGGCADSTRAMP